MAVGQKLGLVALPTRRVAQHFNTIVGFILSRAVHGSAAYAHTVLAHFADGTVAPVLAIRAVRQRVIHATRIRLARVLGAGVSIITVHILLSHTHADVVTRITARTRILIVAGQPHNRQILARPIRQLDVIRAGIVVVATRNGIVRNDLLTDVVGNRIRGP